MPLICPFCVQANSAAALVCAGCSRDIVVPAALIAERDDLIRKRDMVREELTKVRRELEAFNRGKKYRSA